MSKRYSVYHDATFNLDVTQKTEINYIVSASPFWIANITLMDRNVMAGYTKI